MTSPEKKREKDRAMSAVHHVQQVLRRWDPIGVMPDAFEPAADEYDSYAPPIVSLLARGVSVAELSDHLQHIRTVTMGLPADLTRDTRCAEELIGWWKQRAVLSDTAIEWITQGSQVGVSAPMRGVPKDLDLRQFVGRTLVQLGIGEYEIQFRFQPEGLISVEGHWELLDEAGGLVDRSADNSERSAYRVHTLLGKDVAGWHVDPPRSFALSFANGLVLRIFDSSEQYESFSIQPGNIYV